MTDSSKERAHPRIDVRLEVKIPTATMLKVLWTANMSKGGMAIETPHQIQPDTRVKVALVLPGKELLLSATVKHCTPHKNGKLFFVGVEFDELREAERNAIEQIVGTVKEFRTKAEPKDSDVFDDSDIDID